MSSALCSEQGVDFTYEDVAADFLRLHQHQLAEDQVGAGDLELYSSQCKEAFAHDVKERVEQHGLLSFLPDLRRQPISVTSLGRGAPSAGRRVTAELQILLQRASLGLPNSAGKLQSMAFCEGLCRHRSPTPEAHWHCSFVLSPDMWLRPDAQLTPILWRRRRRRGRAQQSLSACKSPLQS